MVSDLPGCRYQSHSRTPPAQGSSRRRSDFRCAAVWSFVARRSRSRRKCYGPEIAQLVDAALIEKWVGCSLRPETHSHSVRAGLGASFTHLIHETNLATRAGVVVIGTVVCCCHDHISIAIDVDVRRCRPPPAET